MKKNLTSIIGALLALALVAAACGGDDDASSADQAVIDAVAGQLRADGDVPDGVNVDCMAGAMVNGMGGAEAMAANYGLTADAINAGQDPEDVELSREQAITLATDAMDCGLGSVMVDEMTADGTMSEDDANCLFDKLDQDVIRDIMAAEFMNPTDAAQVEAAAQEKLFGSMFEAIADCDIDPSAFG